jgi:CHAD domain-containing protein
MKAAKLFRRWKRSQADLLTRLAQLVNLGRDQGEPEQIHELRVVARRLRLLIRLGAPWLGQDVTRRFRDWSGHLSAATDGVRDHDVSLEWLACQAGATALRRQVGGRRNRLWRRCRRQLTPLPADLQEAWSTPAGDRKHETRLERRCARLLRKLRDRVLSQAPHFDHLEAPAQHDLRRVLRRWRYLRELCVPGRRHNKDRLLQQLLRVQGALGERQNLLLTEGILAQLKPSPAVAQLRRSLARECANWEARIGRELRALKRLCR